MLTYKVVHGLAPGYLGPFTCVTDLPSRWSQRTVGTSRLVVSTSRLSTVGSRVLRSPARRHGVTPLKTWHQQNHWPHSSPIQDTHLSRKSFPDYLLDINWLSPLDLAVVQLLVPPKNCLIDWFWLIWTVDLWTGMLCGYRAFSYWRHIYCGAAALLLGRWLSTRLRRPSASTPFVGLCDVRHPTYTDNLRRPVFCRCWPTSVELFAKRIKTIWQSRTV